MTSFEWVLLTITGLIIAAVGAAIRYKIRCLHDRIRQAKEATESTRRLLTAEINRLQAAREALTLSHLEKARALEATIQELGERRLMPDAIHELSEIAIVEMKKVEERDGHNSGENKRHQVYARLIKEWSTMPHWKIGLAIEWAYKCWMAKDESEKPQ